MSENKTTDVLIKIIELLTPLPSEERQRVVKAAFILIGETSINLDNEASTATGHMEKHDLDVTPKVQNWFKQNNITKEELEEVFYLSENEPDFIAADVIGKDMKEKSHNSYIISGISKFIFDGTGTFDDKSARDLCRNLGCYDEKNHARHIKEIGNVVTGTKEKGWTLTAPGLKKAALLIKKMGKV